MNNSFSVEKKVFEVLPDYCVGVIRASIPNKEGAANAVSELFRKELQRFFHQSQGVALRETKNHFCLPFRPTKGWNKSK